MRKVSYPKNMTVDEFKSFRHTVAPPGNRKIMNARKIERDGVKFDSRLEMYMYDLLTMYRKCFAIAAQRSDRSPTPSIFFCRNTIR